MTLEGPQTAAEFVEQLRRTPGFAAQEAERLALDRAHREQYDEDAAGLIQDLAAVGFNVRAVGALMDPSVGDRRALPVLIKWLPIVTYKHLRTELIATVGSKWAGPEAAQPLIQEFRRIDPKTDPGPYSIRSEIGLALSRVADDSVADDLVAIANDKAHRGSLGGIVLALGRMKKRQDVAVPTLLKALLEDNTAGLAARALGMLKAAEAKGPLEKLLTHHESWVRQEAKKALKKIDASVARRTKQR